MPSSSFSSYDPKRVKEVDAMLQEYAGREEKLFEELRLKYAHLRDVDSSDDEDESSDDDDDSSEYETDEEEDD